MAQAKGKTWIWCRGVAYNAKKRSKFLGRGCGFVGVVKKKCGKSEEKPRKNGDLKKN